MGTHSKPAGPPDPVTDTNPHGEIRIQLTVRLEQGLHDAMAAVSDRTGVSLNRMINEACRDALAPPGGAAKIAKERRKLPARPEGEQVRAAAAYILSYLGRGKDASRFWPWGGRFAVRPGDSNSLWRAGAHLAAAYDRKQEGLPWATSAASGAGGR